MSLRRARITAPTIADQLPMATRRFSEALSPGAQAVRASICFFRPAVIAARASGDCRIVSVASAAVGQTSDDVAGLIGLNVTAPARLAAAVTPRFVAEGGGAIINIASVVGLAPEFGATVYGATKAFMIFLSQGLQIELGPIGVYVQAVLPAATRTAIWEKSGHDVDTLPGVMDVSELVDAALVGFDRREPITMPPLLDEGQWSAFDAARRAMIPGFAQSHAAERYSQAA